MNHLDTIPAEIEQERLCQAAELATDNGDNWADGYLPGTFGCHELLDRTATLADMIEQQIQTHPACIANAEWYRQAEQAARILHDLYQQIGAAYLSVDSLEADA